MDQGKIFCRCVDGRCFLEKDTEWAKQNYAQALNPSGIYLDRALLGALDGERLYEKSKWMDALGVSGTGQVCCKYKTEKYP